MKNKGFTLIELLAVIVILAIIALIATPIILGIINDARKESRNRSQEAAVHAVETAYLLTVMESEKNGTTVTASTIMAKVNLDNGDVSGATVTTTDGVSCTLSGDASGGFTLNCTDTKDSSNTYTAVELEGNHLATS